MSRFASVPAPASRAGVGGSHADDPAVGHALLDVAARSGTWSGVLASCAVAFVCALLAGPTAPSMLPLWAAATGSVAVARIVVSRFVRDRIRPAVDGRSAASFDVASQARWRLLHDGLAFASGLAWASLAFAAGTDVDRSTCVVGFALVVALLLASGFQGPHRSSMLFAAPIVVAQAVLLHRLTTDHSGALVAAWLGLVALLASLSRLPWVAIRDEIVARLAHQRRAAADGVVIDDAPLGVVVVRDARIVRCNAALLRMLGYTRDDALLGMPIAAIVPNDDADCDRGDRSAEARPSGLGASPRIVRLLAADGSVVEAMRNVAPLAGGSADDFIGLYEDVRDRLAIEEGYRHALQMTRLVFESAGEGMVIVHDGVIEQANQAMADLVGEPATRLAGRTLQSVFEDPQGWAEIERRFQRLGNTLKLERRVVRSDGRVLWVNVTGCLVDTPGSPATLRSIWILADLSAQKQKEAENWHHANHDVMTGLPNRRFLQDRLDQAIAFARRDGRRVAVLALDLDGFKGVNDTYGHRFGDAVLEEVARRLSTVVRELDSVGRWGGDEFVVVLKEIESASIVEDTVARIIARLSEPIAYEGETLSVGASIGIALCPDHGDDVETLMLAADLAMYESKGAGGNTWRFSVRAALPPRGKYRPAPAAMVASVPAASA